MSSNKCVKCGAPSANRYYVYAEQGKYPDNPNCRPGSKYISGNAIVNEPDGSKTVYDEFYIPVCGKCAFLKKIKKSFLLGAFSGIIGALMLINRSFVFWAYLFCAFSLLNIVIGIISVTKYKKDMPCRESRAAAVTSERFNRGLTESQSAKYFSLGKLGTERDDNETEDR